VNLGEPPWSNPNARIPGVDTGNNGGGGGGSSDSSRHASASVRQAQQALNDRGFDAGPVDGVWGPHTASAVSAFQRANNLNTTGRLNDRTMQALNVSGNDSRTGANSDRDRAYMGGGQVGGGSAGNTGSSSGSNMGGTGSQSGSNMGSTGSQSGSNAGHSGSQSGSNMGNTGAQSGGGMSNTGAPPRTTTTGTGGTTAPGSSGSSGSR